MLLRNLIKLKPPSQLRQLIRNSSILENLSSNSPVLVSAEKDIFTNLALEHWLYTNLKFGFGQDSQPDSQSDPLYHFKTPVVLIWTDKPCVVIGRHQNPWIETNLGILNKAGLKVARRHSGGGCVYHDESNINISVISHRSDFEKRQSNLGFLSKVLGEEYGIECEPTKRHDLIHSATGLKVSGSAAKLGKHNCYHHFTLLVDTDKESLYTAIRDKQQDFIESNSSKSHRSKVINLKELKPDLEVDQVIRDISSAYANHYGAKEVQIDKSKLLDMTEHQQRRREVKAGELESLFKFKSELESWDWIYGMTPKFKLTKSQNMLIGGNEKQVTIVVHVNKGLFESIEIAGDRLPSVGSDDPAEYFRCLIGSPFTYRDAMINVTKLFEMEDDKQQQSQNGSKLDASTSVPRLQFGSEQVYATFLLQLIHDANF